MVVDLVNAVDVRADWGSGRGGRLREWRKCMMLRLLE